MIAPFSVVAIFCEDIREEVGGQDSIIGTMPDNLVVPKIPGALAKLGIYIRIVFDSSIDPGPMALFLREPGGQQHPLGDVPKAVIDLAKQQANNSGNPICGIVARSVLVTFRVSNPGPLSAILVRGKDEYLCGVLNIKLEPPSTSANVSLPPSGLVLPSGVGTS